MKKLSLAIVVSLSVSGIYGCATKAQQSEVDADIESKAGCLETTSISMKRQYPDMPLVGDILPLEPVVSRSYDCSRRNAANTPVPTPAKDAGADFKAERPATNSEKCSSQAEFFAKTIALRQGGAGASFVYGMAIDGDSSHYREKASQARADWYRKTNLIAYDNPKYLFSDPSAEGMKYEDLCMANPIAMTIKE